MCVDLGGLYGFDSNIVSVSDVSCSFGAIDTNGNGMQIS